MPIKIVIIGPESTGKSTLSAQLAEHYKTNWVPEYAREYLAKYGATYTYDDLLTIAKGQLDLEDDYARRLEAQESILNNKLLFVDTDMYVMKVWCEFVFGKCHRFILDKIIERKYDLYLLCNIDLPWTEDVLREYPDIKPRQQLYKMYQDILINQATPWFEISGSYEQRLQTAISHIDRFLNS